jgi:lipopolysaccharide export system permease protein
MARTLAKAVIFVLLATLALVFIIDYIELLRRASDSANASLWRLALLAMARAPAVTEQALPFAVLFGSMAAFLNLSRRLELVVARATGLSAWQFLAPALLVGIFAGVLTTAIYNPLAAALQEKSILMEREMFVRLKTGTPAQLSWLRQKSQEGQSILRAETSLERGHRLMGITAFVFNRQGAFVERVEAASAQLEKGYWGLTNARILKPGSAPQNEPAYRLATNLTAEQVTESSTPATAVAFWELPTVIKRAELSGLPTARFRLQFHALLAKPALFAAMVLIAATVSLKFFRLGGIARIIGVGIGAGFVLYVIVKLAEDLGAATLVHPAAAAWAPALIGALLSVTVLLYQEDG